MKMSMEHWQSGIVRGTPKSIFYHVTAGGTHSFVLILDG
jgi:hypothetical protein